MESGTELLRMHFRFSIFSAFSAAISARILVTMATLRLYQVAMGAGSWPAAACHVPCQACQPVARLILGTLIDSPSRAGPFFVDGIGGRRGLGARNAKRQEIVASRWDEWWTVKVSSRAIRGWSEGGDSSQD